MISFTKDHKAERVIVQFFNSTEICHTSLMDIKSFTEKLNKVCSIIMNAYKEGIYKKAEHNSHYLTIVSRSFLLSHAAQSFQYSENQTYIHTPVIHSTGYICHVYNVCACKRDRQTKRRITLIYNGLRAF